MDYEKTFDDDQPMTVGDARMLKQYVSYYGLLTCSLIMLVMVAIGAAHNALIFAVLAWFSAAFSVIGALAIGEDGYSRMLLSKIIDIDYPPLFDDEQAFGTNHSAAPRGDD